MLMPSCGRVSPDVITTMNALWILFSTILAIIYCSEVIPERAELYYVNPNYLTNASVVIKRNSRRSPYYIHITGTSLSTVGDNVSLHAVFYEYLHNEYKRSFVELDLKLCDLLYKDPWRSFVGTLLINHGAVCPAPPKTYRLHNLTISMDHFPYVWPFERVMVECHAMFIQTKEVIVRARFYVRFKKTLTAGK